MTKSAYFMALVFAGLCILCTGVPATPASDARQGAKTEMRQYKRVHPICEACGAIQTLLRRNEVHHVTPCATDPILASDTNNMITLCRPCHVCLGHGGDGACRKYCPNIREVLKVRIVLENKP